MNHIQWLAVCASLRCKTYTASEMLTMLHSPRYMMPKMPIQSRPAGYPYDVHLAIGRAWLLDDGLEASWDTGPSSKNTQLIGTTLSRR